MEERFGFQALVSRFASLGFILRFIVQTGRSQLCKKEDIIFFQPQFDFASGNLVAVLLKSWRQNCYFTNRGKNVERRVLGSGSGSEQFFGKSPKNLFHPPDIRDFSQKLAAKHFICFLPADSLAPNEPPNMEDLVMDCQTIRYSDYQKRLESGSGCYGFSDYRHLD